MHPGYNSNFVRFGQFSALCQKYDADQFLIDKIVKILTSMLVPGRGQSKKKAPKI
jgi:hypothetical protein